MTKEEIPATISEVEVTEWSYRDGDRRPLFVRVTLTPERENGTMHNVALSYTVNVAGARGAIPAVGARLLVTVEEIPPRAEPDVTILHRVEETVRWPSIRSSGPSR